MKYEIILKCQRLTEDTDISEEFINNEYNIIMKKCVEYIYIIEKNQYISIFIAHIINLKNNCTFILSSIVCL